MHFSIPDTQEFIDDSGNAYLGYNIHINGLFHCTVRYKQLLNLHVQLGKELDVVLPEFPPKKLFPLTVNQQEERRALLEKYIQTIGQNSAINSSELLNGFLLHAQQETAGEHSGVENLDIFLINGQKITISASPGENSEQILMKFCRLIELHEKYACYFALFLMHQEEDDSNINVLRKLQNFESPLVTHKSIPLISVKIVLAKSYWNPAYDEELMQDKVALNLLYVQTASEIDRGWISVPNESRDRLASIRARSNKKEYMKLARSFKYYGYVQFAACLSDYPEPRTRVLVSIGKNELNLRIYQEGEEECEATFEVTRMRCWRITTLHNTAEKHEDEEYSLELSFEYLMSKNQLQWITISSEQAILMSVCLQAMIDELLIKSIGGNKNQEKSSKTWTYMRRDGNSQVIATSPSTDSINKTDQESEHQSMPTKAEPIMRKITERLSAVTVKKSDGIKRSTNVLNKGDGSTENNAFHMIGDDDL
ncbi:sorting nexin-17 [Neodiprion fabricii]|uniref:sorting nexin-17 n=1 Tax=Neodiprion fabricii TaxID=2872261 RepID=UPI001ED9559F|nr:sorting nexin-17 [Neodiprion fabricii]XP_046413988.1 sorting nexin-17 [Neodiprion fabricii]